MIVLRSSFLLITLLLFAGVFAQRVEYSQPGSITNRQSTNLPSNYYTSANGLTCANLKTAVFSIISDGYNELLYSELWATYPRTDKKRNDANTADVVWDMYSDNPNGADPYDFLLTIKQCGFNGQQYSKEGDCYNREHTFPQSWFTELTPMKSDMNHIFPTDGEVNGIRSNFPFGEVSTVSITTRNGSKLGTGNNFGYTGTVFEPINEYKGDIARAIFYMAVRYENQIAGWISNGNANDALNGTSYQVFDPWQLRLLYKWHLQDPVSTKETNRNDSVFVIQKNRNPFIDRPEWVYDMWNCTGLIAATSVQDLNSNNTPPFHIFPQPLLRSTPFVISFKQPTADQSSLTILNSFGQTLYSSIIPKGSTQYRQETTNLPKGLYLIQIKMKNRNYSEKLILQ